MIRREVIHSMRAWGRRYPYTGYGIGFNNGSNSVFPVPYNSFGNGSAMRVSAAGWPQDTLERTRKVTRAKAACCCCYPGPGRYASDSQMEVEASSVTIPLP